MRGDAFILIQNTFVQAPGWARVRLRGGVRPEKEEFISSFFDRGLSPDPELSSAMTEVRSGAPHDFRMILHGREGRHEDKDAHIEAQRRGNERQDKAHLS
ncbi:hypothetical protein [Labrys sp. KNU-23]|uniref:hypothetical protein n=1 Tax=Labrys sp. KNU-23 TaxID=2789216 RepID=UPI00165C98BD|nr:hypothetical protein [Labrys sp. KNU-23]